MIGTVLVLPSPRALLPPYSREDPVAELRSACEQAVAGLEDLDVARLVVLAVPTTPENLRRGVTEPLGHRVARHLLGSRAFTPELALPWTAAALLDRDGVPGPHELPPTTLVVLADGSARRHEKAPGHVHPDAVGFDAEVERALREGDAEALARLDLDTAAAVWCEGAPAFRVLGEVARGRTVEAEVSYADAPYGVAWWVARWRLA